jgi:probable rRNA maturation factor
VPSAARLKRWAAMALAGSPGELTIRVVGLAESRRLNRVFRGKDKPTNVLSFHGAPGDVGDLVVCAPVVAAEALAQGKTAAQHWAHMVIHGVLHLRGFDHIRPRDAKVMEARERAILARLSVPDPYEPL